MARPSLSSCPGYANHPQTDLLLKALNSDEEVARHIQAYACELRLTSPGVPYSGFQWVVSECPLRSVTRLPHPRPHSGAFEWIGDENDGLPAWLWDSATGSAGSTVEATPERLQKGYIAVSWTWGRYVRDGFRYTTGTPWQVPNLPLIDGLDLLTHLKRLLQRMESTRYFWVDLLCINQEAKGDKETEISKQASIFAKAKGTIGFLWNLNHSDLGDALIAFGELLFCCLHFGSPSSSSTSVNSANSTSSVDAFTHSFTRKKLERSFEILRGANWFTSLWALQELILSPASIWVTIDGYCCRTNGELVTTRLFAIAVRLLWSAQYCRELEWQETESVYLATRAMTGADMRLLREQFESEEYKREHALRTACDEQILFGQAPDFLVVETEKMDARPPCIIRAYHNERIVRDAVKHWINWAFGTACIDVSTRTTRPAILVAGQNRDVVSNQARELALLAALKIRPHPGFISCSLHDARTRQTNLLNVILRVEGVKIFNVAHASTAPTVIHQIPNINEEDMSSWEQVGDVMEFIHIQDEGVIFRNERGIDVDVWTNVTLENDPHATSVQYLRNGRKRYIAVLQRGQSLLTSMSPYTADRLNPQTPHFLMQEDISWQGSDGWHLHDAGCLHIPPWAQIQSISKKGVPGTKLFFRLNGSTSDYTIEKRSDFKLIWRTQKWLLEKLGPRPPLFMMLPLGTTRSQRYLDQTSKCEIIGIMLVGKETNKKDMSMTTWYKLGLYRGYGEIETLNWKDGILVMAASDETNLRPQNNSDCALSQERATSILKSLNEQQVGAEEGYEVVKHVEIYDKISNSGMLTSMEYDPIRRCRALD